MEKNTITHDRLLSECFKWSWNTYPETRGLLFHVHNEAKPYPKESRESFVRRLSHMKAIGVVPGVYDFLFWWKARLYALDGKLIGDRLGEEQINWGNAIGLHGAETYTFGSLEAFKAIFKKILANG